MKAIHCETKEQFKRVLEDFEEKGWVWMSGAKPTEHIDYWDGGLAPNYENTCLDYNDKFGYCGKGWYEEDYKIIKAKDYLGGKMYKRGDVLVDKDGYEKKVLGVCGDVYLMSWIDDHKSYEGRYTKQDLDYQGYKLKGEEDTIEIDGKKFSESTIKEALKEYTNG